MLIDALCLLQGDTAASWLPDESVARAGLPSLLASPSWTGKTWFCLTDAFGSRQYAYALRLDGGSPAQQVVHLCILSCERKPSVFFEMLDAIASEAFRAPGSPALLRPLLRLLSGGLPGAAPRASLRLELPTARITVPPAGTDDALLWDGLVALGLADTLELWHALLFERPVLLVSDLMIAC